MARQLRRYHHHFASPLSESCARRGRSVSLTRAFRTGISSNTMGAFMKQRHQLYTATTEQRHQLYTARCLHRCCPLTSLASVGAARCCVRGQRFTLYLASPLPALLSMSAVVKMAMASWGSVKVVVVVHGGEDSWSIQYSVLEKRSNEEEIAAGLRVCGPLPGDEASLRPQ